MNELDKPYEDGIRVHAPATFFITQAPGGRVPAGRPGSRIVTSSRKGGQIPFSCRDRPNPFPDVAAYG
jgi:hypothetical protein